VQTQGRRDAVLAGDLEYRKGDLFSAHCIIQPRERRKRRQYDAHPWHKLDGTMTNFVGLRDLIPCLRTLWSLGGQGGTGIARGRVKGIGEQRFE
jgi:hypothetical protein